MAVTTELWGADTKTKINYKRIQAGEMKFLPVV